MQWNVEGKQGIEKGEHWCSSGLWRQIEGVHVNHQWRTSSSCWCSPGLSDLWVIWSLTPGHTWTINRKMLRTILMWPWSMGREILKPPRLWCRFVFVFVKVTLKEEFGGSLSLYSSPTRVEAARWMYFHLSTIYLIFDVTPLCPTCYHQRQKSVHCAMHCAFCIDISNEN